MTEVKFSDLLEEPIRSGISRPSRVRGHGFPMINMKEIFAFDFIQDVKAELVPAVDDELTKFGLRSGDLLFARQSLSWEGAGKVSIVGDLMTPTLFESHLLRARIDSKLANPTFLYYFFKSGPGRRAVEGIIQQVAAAGIRSKELANLQLRLPRFKQQCAVSEVLRALDEKIAANRRAARAASGLARSQVSRAAAGSRQVALGDVCTLISRGVAPRYTADGFLVLNQKCVREGRVDLQASRIMRTLPKDSAKILQAEDVLVNSTGQGTLGRVARWTKPNAKTSVDSHISIVRIDEDVADPSFVGTLLLDCESRIEALAEGSTGQTELRRQALAMLPLRLPSLDEQREMGGLIRILSRFMDAKDDENHRLTATRDVLLPLLMSGKITVKDAEKSAEEVV